MLENYINHIAFSITALACVVIGGIFFKGGNGWVKTFTSGHHIDTKLGGFFWFIVGPFAVALLAPWLNDLALGFLTRHIANLMWILVGFMAVLWVYYCKKHKYKIL